VNSGICEPFVGRERKYKVCSTGGVNGLYLCLLPGYWGRGKGPKKGGKAKPWSGIDPEVAGLASKSTEGAGVVMGDTRGGGGKGGRFFAALNMRTFCSDRWEIIW